MAKLSPFTIWALVKELRTSAQDARPLVVSGPLAPQLAKELSRGGDPAAIRVDGRPEDGIALVRILGGAPTEEDERVLRDASRAGVPIVGVQTSPDEVFDVPYVLATDIVVCPPGSGFPVEELAGVLAARLGESATGLAARLPVLRDVVAHALIERFSRQNGIIGVAVFVPGADSCFGSPPRTASRSSSSGCPKCSRWSAPASVSARSRAGFSPRSRSRSPAGWSRAGSRTSARAPSARPRSAISSGFPNERLQPDPSVRSGS